MLTTSSLTACAGSRQHRGYEQEREALCGGRNDDLDESGFGVVDQTRHEKPGRTGLLLRMVFEMVKGDPDTTEGIQHSLGRGLPDLIGYLSQQMAAGSLRRMHPILALQLLAGPIVAHLITRPLAVLIGFDKPQEQVVDEIVEAWLRTMAPDKGR